MKNQLTVGDDIIGIEVLAAEHAQEARVIVEEKKYEVSFQAISANRIRLKINGTVLNAYLTKGPEGKDIFIEGRIFKVSEFIPKTGANGRRRKLEDTPLEVTPPMPSVVVRILVSEGDRVVKGQGLIVVSAMKMETTLKAPRNGRIEKINTALRAKVMPGDQLVEIKKETENE